MFRSTRTALAAAAVAIVGLAPQLAAAQDQPSIPPAPDWVERLVLVDAPEPKPWSSETVAAVGSMLEGSWKSTAPVGEADSDDAVHIIMHIARVAVNNHDDVMYAEFARIDQPDLPYRQALLQIIDVDGQLRLRTYEVASQGDGMIAYAGAWAAYEWFPANIGDRLIATMDIMLDKGPRGYEGSTRHPYATSLGGALEMTSAISIEDGRIVTLDQGFDGRGNKVWGEEITFEPWEHPFEIVRDNRGLVYIDYNLHEEVNAPDDRDAIIWAFQSWLQENARIVGDSDFEEVGIRYAYPLGRQFIAGLRAPLSEVWMGRTVRAFMPANLAYGSRGWKVRMIPEDAPIIYYLRCVRIEPLGEPVPVPTEPANPGNG